MSDDLVKQLREMNKDVCDDAADHIEELSLHLSAVCNTFRVSLQSNHSAVWKQFCTNMIDAAEEYLGTGGDK